MVEWVKVPATKPENLSLIPWPLMREGESWVLQILL